MSQFVGPVSIVWESGPVVVSAAPDSVQWGIQILGDPPAPRGPSGAAWFNDDEWSGVETHSWLAWISNKTKAAAVWGMSLDLAQRDALAVVIPAVLRREGFLDGHGAVIAPDCGRPDEGVFVTGLSGSGKSSLTVSCALGGARFLSDDSVAIGPDSRSLRAWSRRSSISLSPMMHARLVPDAGGRPFDDKIVFDAPATFPEGCAISLRVKAIVFLERGDAASPPGSDQLGMANTRILPLDASESYRRLLMGHPILAIDRGSRPSFAVLRQLADLPAYHMAGGHDLLDPRIACDTLAALLPT